MVCVVVSFPPQKLPFSSLDFVVNKAAAEAARSASFEPTATFSKEFSTVTVVGRASLSIQPAVPEATRITISRPTDFTTTRTFWILTGKYGRSLRFLHNFNRGWFCYRNWTQSPTNWIHSHADSCNSIECLSSESGTNVLNWSPQLQKRFELLNFTFTYFCPLFPERVQCWFHHMPATVITDNVKSQHRACLWGVGSWSAARGVCGVKTRTSSSSTNNIINSASTTIIYSIAVIPLRIPTTCVRIFQVPTAVPRRPARSSTRIVSLPTITSCDASDSMRCGRCSTTATARPSALGSGVARNKPHSVRFWEISQRKSGWHNERRFKESTHANCEHDKTNFVIICCYYVYKLCFSFPFTRAQIAIITKVAIFHPQSVFPCLYLFSSLKDRWCRKHEQERKL